MSDSDATIPRCLYTTICPNCGYSLVGLPERTTCPECGRLNDQTQIILYGHPRGRHENLGNAKGSRVLWLMLPIAGMFGLQAVEFVLRGRSFGDVFFISALILMPWAMRLAWVFRRQKMGFPAPAQIRMSEAGCVQYDMLPSPSAAIELGSSYSWILGLAVAVWMYLGYVTRGLNLIFAWIYIILGIIMAIVCWFPSRKVRRAIAKLPDNAIADRNAAFVKIRPWEKASTFRIVPMKENNHWLQIYGTSGSHAVDAEILLTAEQVEALRTWLKARPSSSSSAASAQASPRPIA